MPDVRPIKKPPAARTEAPRPAARADAPRAAARPEAPRAAPRPGAPSAPRAEAPRVDQSQSEHIFIESDEAPDPRSAAHTVGQRWRLANPLRREVTKVTLFDEGYLEVVEHVR